AYAGAQSPSFVQATKDLEALAEVCISRERVQRWTKRVGEERVAEMEAAATAYQELPLPAQRENPSAQTPQVACLQVDGGRIQILERLAEIVGEPGWRETLVGCLLSMTSKEHTEDPCPTIPPMFVDVARISELSREIKGFSSDSAESSTTMDGSQAGREGRPEPLVRSVVATREGVETFGERLVAAAHARGFNAARRKAFVADGSATNWGLHRRHFSHYTPILDFTHAICYVYAAAMTGRAATLGWHDYCQWAQWLWAGEITKLIAAVASRAEELGPAAADAPETSPSSIVAKTLGYLRNQSSRMRYAEYRKLGLPITSSHIESTIKQINRRVKGTEKFWDRGAEPILQLAADHLSETQEFDRFWKTRRRNLPTTRGYRTAA
ncbi:MAG: hypothetical protein WEA31_03785, partial [Pirellulales bacterium]